MELAPPARKLVDGAFEVEHEVGQACVHLEERAGLLVQSCGERGDRGGLDVRHGQFLRMGLSTRSF
jgi:hypothetical protein